MSRCGVSGDPGASGESDDPGDSPTGHTVAGGAASAGAPPWARPARSSAAVITWCSTVVQVRMRSALAAATAKSDSATAVIWCDDANLRARPEGE